MACLFFNKLYFFCKEKNKENEKEALGKVDLSIELVYNMWGRKHNLSLKMKS